METQVDRFETPEPEYSGLWKRTKVGSVVVEDIPSNRDCKIFHVRKPLYDAGVKTLVKWERNAQDFKTHDYHVPGIFDLIAEKAFGVENLFSSNCFSVYVTKGAAFEWEEIEPTVCEILNGYSA